MIGAHSDASYTVDGVAQCGGKNLAEGVQTGDQLIGTNDRPVTGSLADVLHELQGTRGEVKNLVVERNRKQISVKPPVTSLW